MAAFAGLCTGAAHYGMGVHADHLEVDESTHGMLLLLAGQSVIAIAMGLSKCAVAAFLMRIVVKKWFVQQKNLYLAVLLTSARHIVFLWFWNISIMVLSILLAITVFAQCTPVQSIWDPRIPSESCPLSLTVMAKVMCGKSYIVDRILYPASRSDIVNQHGPSSLTLFLHSSPGWPCGI